MIQDLSGSWCIKGIHESTSVMDSPVPLMHHDPDRSFITDPDLWNQSCSATPTRPSELLPGVSGNHFSYVLLTVKSPSCI